MWEESTNEKGDIVLEPNHIKVSQSDCASVSVLSKDVKNRTLVLGVYFALIGNGFLTLSRQCGRIASYGHIVFTLALFLQGMCG